MRAALLAALLTATLADAAKPKRPPKKPPPAAAAEAPPAPAAAAVEAPPRGALPPAPGDEVPTPQLLTRARAAVEALEYAQALVLCEALVQRDDASRDAQVEGFWLRGQALAVLRDPVEAEPSFRTLVRLDPSFEPPADAGPKILAAFRKVQVEERALADRLARDARARLVEGLSLTGTAPPKVRGGRPAPFSFRLRDPTGAVDELKVSYRLKGATAPFSSLALARAEDGQYTGAVPGEVTANEGGATLEYFVEAVDAKGPLLSRGDAQVPLAIELTAGKPGRAVPRRWYSGSLGATLVLAAATAGLGVAALVAERSHAALATPSMGPPFDAVSSQDWYSSQLTAQRLIIATLIGLGTTALFAIVTTVLSRFVEAPDSAD